MVWFDARPDEDDHAESRDEDQAFSGSSLTKKLREMWKVGIGVSVLRGLWKCLPKANQLDSVERP